MPIRPPRGPYRDVGHNRVRPRLPTGLMRRLALFALACLALAPLAVAQNATEPDPHPSSGLAGPQESIEDESGATYGIALLIGTIAIGGLLAFITMRKPQRRGPK